MKDGGETHKAGSIDIGSPVLKNKKEPEKEHKKERRESQVTSLERDLALELKQELEILRRLETDLLIRAQESGAGGFNNNYTFDPTQLGFNNYGYRLPY